MADDGRVVRATIEVHDGAPAVRNIEGAWLNSEIDKAVRVFKRVAKRERKHMDTDERANATPARGNAMPRSRLLTFETFSECPDCACCGLPHCGGGSAWVIRGKEETGPHYCSQNCLYTHGVKGVSLKDDVPPAEDTDDGKDDDTPATQDGAGKQDGKSKGSK